MSSYSYHSSIHLIILRDASRSTGSQGQPGREAEQAALDTVALNSSQTHQLWITQQGIG